MCVATARSCYNRMMLELSFRALNHPNVRRVVASQGLSQVCDKLMVVALLWVIADRYAAAWVPWYVAVGGLPHLLLAGSSAKIIGKLGVLRAVVFSELFRGVVLIAFAVYVGSETPPILGLLILTGLINMASAIFNPAIMTLPLSIANDEQRPQVNAMIDACFSIANVVGPVFSVILFAKYGLTTLMYLNGASYLLAAWIQSGVTFLPTSVADDPGSLQVDAVASSSLVSILRRELLLRQMAAAFLAINIFGAPFLILFPLYVKQVYHQDIASLAILESALGAGALVGAIMLSFAQFKTKIGPRIVRAIICVGFALVVFSLSQTLEVGSVALFVMGLALTSANIWILTLFQSIVPSTEVPSVMALVNLVSVAATPLSLGCTGLLVNYVAVTQIALISSLSFLAIGAILLFLPRLREVSI